MLPKIDICRMMLVGLAGWSVPNLPPEAWAATLPLAIQEIQILESRPRLTILGQAGRTNTLLYASALAPAEWKELTNILVTHSPYTVVDDSAALSPARFYRVREASGTAPAGPANMVWIAPGTFTLGSPATETDRLADEGPQTLVTISQGFWIGQFEVTQRGYLAVMGKNPAHFTGDLDRPVEMVTWVDATNYCGKLTAQEQSAGRLPVGYQYRLPTEAEWEYACRAGTTTATAFGDTLSSSQANFDGNYPYNGAAVGPYLGQTTRVGSYGPNAWGLRDMHGNVREWCLDWHGSSYPGRTATDPHGPDWGTRRVQRGGCWFEFGNRCRSALRSSGLPSNWDPGAGFRVVLARSP